MTYKLEFPELQPENTGAFIPTPAEADALNGNSVVGQPYGSGVNPSAQQQGYANAVYQQQPLQQYGQMPYMSGQQQGYMNTVYQQQPSQQYGQMPYPQGVAANVQVAMGQGVSQSSNGMGIAGFVLALLAWVLIWVPMLSWILWLLGAIFSVIGVFKEPRGLAIVGTVLSFAAFIALIILAASIGIASIGIALL